ncbi:MAG: Glu/Leu/Phe/Val dehydrogenase dimerization domain-containing protein [Atribacterota bacterium]|jgi:glutamate dehydrogenase (NAD(P)+)
MSVKFSDAVKKEMSEGELERLSRRYIYKISSVIGPKKDIPAPDVYATPRLWVGI